MKDLLKEAIADAKAVRETALANAKLALEEAFTPRIQSMISAKLSEEMDDEDEVEDEAPEVEAEPEVETDEPEMEAPETEDEAPEVEVEDEDDDLDLDEILRELESDEEVDEMYGEDEEVNLDELEGSMSDEDDETMTEEDEEIDLEEIVRSLREEDTEDEMTEEESMEDESELEEAYNVIRFLKSKINEVNLLNAKLLYSNKLFRNFSLNEGQKMKVIESFDRSATLREVKLVYSTLAESFKMPAAKRKPIRESFASKPIASTKPAKQVLSEGTELASRFQKLAGLIK